MGAEQSKIPTEQPREKALGHGSSAEQELYDDYVVVNEKPGGAVRRPAEELPIAQMLDWQKAILADPKNRLAMTALSAQEPNELLTNRRLASEDLHVFNLKVPFEGAPITNQRSSGRCWLFASTNVFRVAIMQKYRLDAFELSQNYLFFWDKLEKSNYFLEQVLDTVDMDLDSRLVQTLVQSPLSDGGQWDMVVNLVDKYGLVPQVLYPDSYSASSSRTLNAVVFSKLREDALVLRDMARQPGTTAETLSATKTGMVRDIYTVLTLALGAPPSATDGFSWTFADRDGRAREVRSTPLEFARDVYSAEFRVTHSTIAGMVSLVNDPRHDYMRRLTVDRLGNVVGGRGVTYVNVAMSRLKSACVAMLRAGQPVFFGCDVGKLSSSALGVMDLGLVDYELGFNVGGGGLLAMTKAERLRSGESAMTHAMVLTAVHVDERTGATVRWRVQNSWGEAAGDKGWFVMRDSWMNQFVYQAVVDAQVLSRDVRDVLEQEPVVLPLWDPMGALA